MATRVIPWPDAPRWTLDVQLDGEVYTFRARWNTRMKTWALDILTADGDVLLRGVRAVLDYPLLPRWRTGDMPPGELFVVCPTGRCRQDPGRDSIGDDEPMRFVYVEADS